MLRGIGMLDPTRVRMVMPLFENECRGCGSRFEHLSRPDRPAV